MATTATRLESNGTYLANGSFDEHTANVLRVTVDTVSCGLLDEVTYAGNSTFAKREDISNTVFVTSEFDEFTGAPVVDGSLVLWLDAGQNASYAGSGSTWTNLANVSTNTTLTNSPTFDNQGWLTFNGTNQSANTNISSSIFLPSSDFTITTTLVIDSYANVANAAGTVCGAMNFDGYGLFWEASTTQLFIGCMMRARASGTIVDRRQVVDIGEWYQATMSYSSSQNFMKLYINGNLGNTTGAIAGSYDTGIPTTIRLAFSNSPRGAVSSRFLPGRISQCMIYNRALSDDEVGQNFNAVRRRYGI